MLNFLVAQGQQQGSLRGQVKTEQGEPLAHATVIVKNGPTKLTDSTGRFVLEGIAVGKQEVTISSAGYATRTLTVQIQEGKEASLNTVLQAEGFLNEVVVTAGRKLESIREVPSSVTIIQAKQIREQAGYQSFYYFHFG